LAVCPESEPAFRVREGRVHLTIQRDPESGREVVGLKAPLFDEPWQDEVTTSTVATALAVLGATPSLARVLELAQTAADSASRLVNGLLARAPAGSVACKAGCDHCCHVVVGVIAPEAFLIFDHIERVLSSSALSGLRARIAEFYERTRGLSSAERFSPAYPCVFLEAGCCSIYEVRPLACRGMNSLSARECATRLLDPVVRRLFATAGGGHLYVEPIRAFRAISAGLQLGLAELYGLDMRPLELSSAMHVLFERTATTVDAWLAGGQPFDAALCTSQ
jgi:hypothetical protein